MNVRFFVGINFKNKHELYHSAGKINTGKIQQARSETLVCYIAVSIDFPKANLHEARIDFQNQTKAFP